MNLFLWRFPDLRQRGEYVNQSVHVTDVFAAHSDGSAIELHVMGVKQTDAAELLFQGQSLDLELNAVVAEDIRPDVGFGRRLQVSTPVLEYDFGLADGEAIL